MIETTNTNTKGDPMNLSHETALDSSYVSTFGRRDSVALAIARSSREGPALARLSYAALRALARERFETATAEGGRLHGTPMARATFPATPKILGSSTKIDAGEGVGVLGAVAYLSPATESGCNLCPWATALCARACLGTESGQMIFSSSRNARLWKTALWIAARPVFRALVIHETAAVATAALAQGKIPSVRIDGSSDTGEGAKIARACEGVGVFAPVRFYDYTKSVLRALAYAKGATYPANYHLTFSATGENDDDVRAVIASGGNVAVVYDVNKGDALPAYDHGFDAYVLNGDAHDARFLDRSPSPYVSAGVVVGLRFKTARNRARALEAAGVFVRSRALAQGGPSPLRIRNIGAGY